MALERINEQELNLENELLVALLIAGMREEKEQPLTKILLENSYNTIDLIKTILTILQQEENDRPKHKVKGMAFLITKLPAENLAETLFNLFSLTIKSSDNLTIINERINLLRLVIEQRKPDLKPLVAYQNPESGDTLFHLAAQISNQKLIDICYKNEGKPFVKNKSDETPLYWAAVRYAENKNETARHIWEQLSQHYEYTFKAVINSLLKAISVENHRLIRFLLEILEGSTEELHEWEKELQKNTGNYSLQRIATDYSYYDLALGFIKRRFSEQTSNSVSELYKHIYTEYWTIYNDMKSHEVFYKMQNISDEQLKIFKEIAYQKLYRLSWLMDFYNQGNALEVATASEFFTVADWLMQQLIERNSDATQDFFKLGQKIYRDANYLWHSQTEVDLTEIQESMLLPALFIMSKIIINPNDSGMIDTLNYQIHGLNLQFANKSNIQSLITKLAEIAQMAQARLFNQLKLLKPGDKIDFSEHNSVGDEKSSPAPQALALLHLAIKTGDLANTQLLLTHNPGLLNAVDSNGLTALHQAILSKHPNQMEIFNYLIKQDPQLDFRGTSGFHEGITPLWIATRIGKIAMMTALIAKKADVNLADTTEGSTPLMNVIMLLEKNKLTAEGSWLAELKKIVAQLLNNHANPNQAAHNGITALHWAIRDKDPEVTKLLIEHKANIAAEASAVIEPFNKLIKIKPLFFSTPHHQHMLALLDQYAEAKIIPIPAEMEDGTPISLPEVAVSYGHTQALAALTLRTEFSPEIDTLAKNFSKTFADCPQDKQAEIATILIQYLLTKQTLDYENLLFDLWRFLIKDLSPVITTVLEDKRIKINKLSRLWYTEGLSLLDIVIDENKLDIAICFITQLKKSKPDFSSLYEAGINAYQEALSMQATQQLSAEESEHLNKSLFALNGVLLNPTDEVAIAQLKRVAYEIAPGKPSFWKKFIGALLTIAAIALSIVAGVLSLGIAVIVPTAIVGVLGCGIFANGLQQKGLSKKMTCAADIAEQTTAAPASKS